MDPQNDSKLESLIMQELYHHPGHEAILTPALFKPPIMLSNIFRIGCVLKKRGLTTGPDRRMGGWHLRLLEAGLTACQQGTATSAPVAQPGNRPSLR